MLLAVHYQHDNLYFEDFHHNAISVELLTGGIRIMYIQAAQWREMQRVRSRRIKNIVFLDTFPVTGHISTWNKSTDI